MKKFKVGFSFRQIGNCVIEANSAEEASDIMDNYLAQNSLDNLVFDSTDREYDAESSEEI